ncbi:MAG TPA: hypothetical protein VIM11_04135 [Tepidisphaeraceae bacterium]|jgi:hypothetical protein
MAVRSRKDLENIWSSAPKSIVAAFLKSYGIHPNELPAGTELYKYSGRNPYNSSDRFWSPWWSLVRGPGMKLNSGEIVLPPTLDDQIARAKRLGVSDVRLARVRSAVKHEWNDLTGLWVVRLTSDTWGMFGRNSGLPTTDRDPDQKNVFNIGGNYQIYLPKLVYDNLTTVARGTRSDTGRS